ncbi:hypothetical protein [Kamptonema formosum]|uniref:hypothetical protein n=1 Tax=Kamptonema formosum TaxID=331992 RepID=UPI0012DE0EB3|nr:hypothetical protein [Oscillatoria sp. PCC 10802]
MHYSGAIPPQRDAGGVLRQKPVACPVSLEVGPARRLSCAGGIYKYGLILG